MSPTFFNDDDLQDRRSRPRLLMVAVGCHPTQAMEWRLGWRRAMLAAQTCDVTVLHGPGVQSDELAKLAAQERGTSEGIRFVGVQRGKLGDVLNRSEVTYYLGYRRWARKALQVARQLHDEQPFDLVHHVNYCGFREPGMTWKLGVPFIWGPVGGTQDFPRQFLGSLPVASAAREVVRTWLNWWQLRCSVRVRRAANAASAVLAATSTAQRDLKQTLGIDAIRQLETGLDCEIAQPRTLRNPADPLRVLWAGRLRAWKALPLLLEALAQLPETTRVEVRVLGSGPCRDAWRRKAERLGVAHLIEWVDWPEYADTLPHYRWADVFAFTSLRDTSGTGLIEALAAGTPVLGLDHQGAADIMTPDCAVAVPVTTPDQTSADLAAGLVALHDDPDRLLALSRGAQRRAADYCWAERSEFTQQIYEQALAGAASAERQTASPIARPRPRNPELTYPDFTPEPPLGVTSSPSA
ncbi:MAG: glycosyltransferase family 4 protein [Planctomycetota bacterium]